MPAAAKARTKVADEVWIAAALLHKEHPRKADFSVEEVLARATKEAAKKEAGKNPLRPGVYVHIVQHCVANRPPNPGRYRMLFETTPGRRRLFRTGDTYNPAREGAKSVPAADELPARYHNLLDWYAKWDAANYAKRMDNDPLMALREIGGDLWKGIDPDQYVRQLREGWE
jgi:hypothetical protein